MDRADELDDLATRLRASVGSLTHPEDTRRLHDYWTKGEGLAKWAGNPHPWTSLYHHLVKFMPPDKAKRTAAQWFHDVKGYWPGDQKGKNPVGPG